MAYIEEEDSPPIRRQHPGQLGGVNAAIEGKMTEEQIQTEASDIVVRAGQPYGDGPTTPPKPIEQDMQEEFQQQQPYRASASPAPSRPLAQQDLVQPPPPEDLPIGGRPLKPGDVPINTNPDAPDGWSIKFKESPEGPYGPIGEGTLVHRGVEEAASELKLLESKRPELPDRVSTDTGDLNFEIRVTPGWYDNPEGDSQIVSPELEKSESKLQNKLSERVDNEGNLILPDLSLGGNIVIEKNQEGEDVLAINDPEQDALQKNYETLLADFEATRGSFDNKISELKEFENAIARGVGIEQPVDMTDEQRASWVSTLFRNQSQEVNSARNSLVVKINEDVETLNFMRNDSGSEFNLARTAFNERQDANVTEVKAFSSSLDIWKKELEPLEMDFTSKRDSFQTNVEKYVNDMAGWGKTYQLASNRFKTKNINAQTKLNKWQVGVDAYNKKLESWNNQANVWNKWVDTQQPSQQPVTDIVADIKGKGKGFYNEIIASKPAQMNIGGFYQGGNRLVTLTEKNAEKFGGIDVLREQGFEFGQQVIVKPTPPSQTKMMWNDPLTGLRIDEKKSGLTHNKETGEPTVEQMIFHQDQSPKAVAAYKQMRDAGEDVPMLLFTGTTPRAVSIPGQEKIEPGEIEEEKIHGINITDQTFSGRRIRELHRYDKTGYWKKFGPAGGILRGGFSFIAHFGTGVETVVTIDPKTGKPIMGQEELPDLFTAGIAMLPGDKDVVVGREGSILGGAAQMVGIEPGEGMRIGSEAELQYYKKAGLGAFLGALAGEIIIARGIGFAGKFVPVGRVLGKVGRATKVTPVLGFAAGGTADVVRLVAGKPIVAAGKVIQKVPGRPKVGSQIHRLGERITPSAKYSRRKLFSTPDIKGWKGGELVEEISFKGGFGKRIVPTRIKTTLAEKTIDLKSFPGGYKPKALSEFAQLGKIGKLKATPRKLHEIITGEVLKPSSRVQVAPKKHAPLLSMQKERPEKNILDYLAFDIKKRDIAELAASSQIGVTQRPLVRGIPGVEWAWKKMGGGPMGEPYLTLSARQKQAWLPGTKRKWTGTAEQLVERKLIQKTHGTAAAKEFEKEIGETHQLVSFRGKLVEQPLPLQSQFKSDFQWYGVKERAKDIPDKLYERGGIRGIGSEQPRVVQSLQRAREIRGPQRHYARDERMVQEYVQIVDAYKHEPGYKKIVDDLIREKKIDIKMLEGQDAESAFIRFWRGDLDTITKVTGKGRDPQSVRYLKGYYSADEKFLNKRVGEIDAESKIMNAKLAKGETEFAIERTVAGRDRGLEVRGLKDELEKLKKERVELTDSIHHDDFGARLSFQERRDVLLRNLEQYIEGKRANTVRTQSGVLIDYVNKKATKSEWWKGATQEEREKFMRGIVDDAVKPKKDLVTARTIDQEVIVHGHTGTNIMAEVGHKEFTWNSKNLSSNQIKELSEKAGIQLKDDAASEELSLLIKKHPELRGLGSDLHDIKIGKDKLGDHTITLTGSSTASSKYARQKVVAREINSLNTRIGKMQKEVNNLQKGPKRKNLQNNIDRLTELRDLRLQQYKGWGTKDFVWEAGITGYAKAKPKPLGPGVHGPPDVFGAYKGTREEFLKAYTDPITGKYTEKVLSSTPRLSGIHGVEQVKSFSVLKEWKGKITPEEVFAIENNIKFVDDKIESLIRKRKELKGKAEIKKINKKIFDATGERDLLKAGLILERGEPPKVWSGLMTKGGKEKLMIKANLDDIVSLRVNETGDLIKDLKWLEQKVHLVDVPFTKTRYQVARERISSFTGSPGSEQHKRFFELTSTEKMYKQDKKIGNVIMQDKDGAELAEVPYWFNEFITRRKTYGDNPRGFAEAWDEFLLARKEKGLKELKGLDDVLGVEGTRKPPPVSPDDFARNKAKEDHFKKYKKDNKIKDLEERTFSKFRNADETAGPEGRQIRENATNKYFSETHDGTRTFKTGESLDNAWREYKILDEEFAVSDKAIRASMAKDVKVRGKHPIVEAGSKEDPLKGKGIDIFDDHTMKGHGRAGSKMQSVMESPKLKTEYAKSLDDMILGPRQKYKSIQIFDTKLKASQKTGLWGALIPKVGTIQTPILKQGERLVPQEKVTGTLLRLDRPGEILKIPDTTPKLDIPTPTKVTTRVIPDIIPVTGRPVPVHQTPILELIKIQDKLIPIRPEARPSQILDLTTFQTVKLMDVVPPKIVDTPDTPLIKILDVPDYPYGRPGTPPPDTGVGRPIPPAPPGVPIWLGGAGGLGGAAKRGTKTGMFARQIKRDIGDLSIIGKKGIFTNMLGRAKKK